MVRAVASTAYMKHSGKKCLPHSASPDIAHLQNGACAKQKKAWGHHRWLTARGREPEALRCLNIYYQNYASPQNVIVTKYKVAIHRHLIVPRSFN